jgi:hypothetical protein
MKKRSSKLKFSQLKDEYFQEIIDLDELSSLVGGDSSSCVFNCFDYLDGASYSASHYYYSTQYYLGYVPGSNGGVNTSDIGTIGSFGTMSITEQNGLTAGNVSSHRSIAIYNVGNIGHAVIVFNHNIATNKLIVLDPSDDNKTKRLNVNSVTTFYVVGEVGSAQYGTSGS